VYFGHPDFLRALTNLSAASKAAYRFVGWFQSSRQICWLLSIQKGLKNWAKFTKMSGLYKGLFTQNSTF
jgi:hypothetical protein